MIIIKIHNFSDGIHELEFNESIKSLSLGEPFEDFVLCKIRMDKSNSQIVIDGQLSAKAKLTCDRCNDDFLTELSNQFKNVYLFANEQETSDDENVHFLNREADKIDLTDDFRDYARLSIPMKILCSEDCRGLCFKCGTNLNKSSCDCEKGTQANSVWADLEKLKNLDIR